MKRLIASLVPLIAMLACAEHDAIDEDSFELQAQVAAADAGTNADASAATTASTGDIGSACMVDGDCKVAGTTCRKEQALPFGPGIPFPGGFCTKSCKTNPDCGAGAACPLAAAELFLPGISVCVKPCKVAADCREGYRCAATSLGAIPGLGAPQTGAATNFCLPQQPALPPGGAIPGFPGGGAIPGFPAGGIPGFPAGGIPGASPTAPKPAAK